MVPVIEFTTELTTDPVLNIPREAAAQLPKTGRVRIIIMPLPAENGDGSEDEEWLAAAYEQFMRDDSPEDAVYDRYTYR